MHMFIEFAEAVVLPVKTTGGSQVINRNQVEQQQTFAPLMSTHDWVVD